MNSTRAIASLYQAISFKVALQTDPTVVVTLRWWFLAHTVRAGLGGNGCGIRYNLQQQLIHLSINASNRNPADKFAAYVTVKEAFNRSRTSCWRKTTHTTHTNHFHADLQNG
jgi:hypothetical protein